MDNVTEKNETLDKNVTAKSENTEGKTQEKMSEQQILAESIISNKEAKAKAREERKKSFAYKLKKVIITIVVAIAVLLTGVICYLRLPVSDYYKASHRTFKIPDTNHGFVAQGLDYDASAGDYYVTGYMNDGSASPIYIVDGDTGKCVRKVLMMTPEGKPFSPHAGGIAMYNGKLYVAGGNASCMYVFSPEEIRAAAVGDSVAYKDVVDLSKDGDNIGVAFVTQKDGILYAGEFYRPGNYETNPMHYVDTTDGTNKALMVGMTLDGNTPEIVSAYSIPEEIQGLFFTDESLYLSSSYAVAFSGIHEYKRSDIKQEGTITVLGSQVPLYVLDAKYRANLFKIPPMSEEIVIIDNMMYTMCESASNKYIFGKLTGAGRVYATDLALLHGEKTESSTEVDNE